MDYTKGVPGGVIAQTFKTTGTVTVIDPAKRTATLRGTDGKKFAVKFGPAAGELDLLRVGDRINATVMQKIVASVEPEGGAADDRATDLVARKPEGGSPDGRVTENFQVVAEVIQLDAVKRTATLRFEDGSLVALPIREDLDLGQRKIGERVVFRVIEMVVLSFDRLKP